MRNERRRRPPRKASAPLIRRRRRERGRASAEGERKTARRRSRSRRGAARKLIDAIKRPFGRPASGHKQTGYEVCLRTCLCARLAVTVVPGRGRAHTHTQTHDTRAHMDCGLRGRGDEDFVVFASRRSPRLLVSHSSPSLAMRLCYRSLQPSSSDSRTSRLQRKSDECLCLVNDLHTGGHAGRGGGAPLDSHGSLVYLTPEGSLPTALGSGGKRPYGRSLERFFLEED